MKTCWKKIYNGWYEMEWRGRLYSIIGNSGNYRIEQHLIKGDFIKSLGSAKSLKDAERLVDSLISLEIYAERVECQRNQR